MKYIPPVSTDALIETAEAEGLYQKLLDQLNKDFNLANEGLDLHPSTTPYELRVQLTEKVYRLLQYSFAEYLNLLYIIDVPETDIKALDGSDLGELSGQVAFLILKREWQKVWFRNRL